MSGHNKSIQMSKYCFLLAIQIWIWMWSSYTYRKGKYWNLLWNIHKITSNQLKWIYFSCGSMPWFLSFQPKKFQAWFCWKEEGFLAQCSSFKLVYKKKFILIEFANFKKNSFWLDAIQVLSNWFMKINLFWSNSPISCCTFFIQAKQIELEVLEYSKYIIGTFSSSTANQRAAQKNCYIEWDFGDPSICTN